MSKMNFYSSYQSGLPFVSLSIDEALSRINQESDEDLSKAVSEVLKLYDEDEAKGLIVDCEGLFSELRDIVMKWHNWKAEEITETKAIEMTKETESSYKRRIEWLECQELSYESRMKNRDLLLTKKGIEIEALRNLLLIYIKVEGEGDSE